MHPSFVSVQASSFSGTFCIFLCHLRWMLDSDFAGLELFCVLLRTHNALGFVFLCFLFSLPSTSSSPHLHLPNPSLSNVHLAEECVTLQSWQYAPNLPVVGTHVCVYANILAPRCIVEASERVITYARFCIAFFQHVFSTAWTLDPSFVHATFVKHVGRWDTVQSQHHCADLPGDSTSFQGI